MAKDTYFYALGRRKSATARVRLMGGKGNIVINGRPADVFSFGKDAFLLTDDYSGVVYYVYLRKSA